MDPTTVPPQQPDPLAEADLNLGTPNLPEDEAQLSQQQATPAVQDRGDGPADDTAMHDPLPGFLAGLHGSQAHPQGT